MTDFETRDSEHSVETVMRYFANGFEVGPDREIWHVDWWLDSTKGSVLFRITTRPLNG